MVVSEAKDKKIMDKKIFIWLFCQQQRLILKISQSSKNIPVLQSDGALGSGQTHLNL
jgi:hypothetical protein